MSPSKCTSRFPNTSPNTTDTTNTYKRAQHISTKPWGQESTAGLIILHAGLCSLAMGITGFFNTIIPAGPITRGNLEDGGGR
ncbi:hypothetical protein Pmani_026428 [Petrolisthes manimaculis]|uniref:Uncharacterized protein n=1 Tax=Petrolisthes manimaculis TaxID=1843537 RepID=A0AAE1TXV6_9EUCA|nr:hypothetical protein Pmani_026428 [Petrolisthes manimaculis]